MIANPKAGLIFPDFETGDAVYVSLSTTSSPRSLIFSLLTAYTRSRERHPFSRVVKHQQFSLGQK
jgi:ABC-type sulfate transport system permease component